jgi:hypothetical protein
MIKIFEEFEIKDLYEAAKNSPEYQNLIDHDFIDISTERQQKNGTFQFRARRTWDIPNNYSENIKDIVKKYYGMGVLKNTDKDSDVVGYAGAYHEYGVFKYKENKNGWNFRVRTSMTSHSMTRHEIENSYEDAFNTIFRLFNRLYNMRINQFKKWVVKQEKEIEDSKRPVVRMKYDSDEKEWWIRKI